MLLSFLRSIDRDVTREMNIGCGNALLYEERTATAVPKAQKEAQKNFLHILQGQTRSQQATGADSAASRTRQTRQDASVGGASLADGRTGLLLTRSGIHARFNGVPR
ncbi:hypothetical protein SLT36_26335 [Aminobacter sp. BA135]|uniref:hypothetical protein n=1 Tax=Aminobacter sp. BA135 TaxID=537596 RepID=UPI003D7A6CDB